MCEGDPVALARLWEEGEELAGVAGSGLTHVPLALPPPTPTPAFLLQYHGRRDPLLPYLPASGQAQAAASHDGQD